MLRPVSHWFDVTRRIGYGLGGLRGVTKKPGPAPGPLLSPGEMCDVAEQHSTSGTVAIRFRDRTAILGRNALRCDMRLQPLTLLKETCCHNTV